jgi:hypothetical protein
VRLIQEDDSIVDGMVVDWNPADEQHTVCVYVGTPDETCEALPLLGYPDSYTVRARARVVCGIFGGGGRGVW